MAGHVRLAIYNVGGQLVRELVDEEAHAGSHTVAWDGHDDVGRKVASGVYLYRLQAGSTALVRRMTLVR